MWLLIHQLRKHLCVSRDSILRGETAVYTLTSKMPQSMKTCTRNFTFIFSLFKTNGRYFTRVRLGKTSALVWIMRVAQAPGMLGTFSLPPRVSDRDMHYGTCVTHVPWCMPGSLISGFRWRKRSRHSQRMRNSHFYVSGKKHITWTNNNSDYKCVYVATGCNE